MPDPGRVLTPEQVAGIVKPIKNLVPQVLLDDTEMDLLALARSHERLREAAVEGHDVFLVLNDWLATTGYGAKMPQALRAKCGEAIVSLGRSAGEEQRP